MLILLKDNFNLFHHLFKNKLRVLRISQNFIIKHIFDFWIEFSFFLFPFLFTKLSIFNLTFHKLYATLHSINSFIFTDHNPCIFDIWQYSLIKRLDISLGQIQKIKNTYILFIYSFRTQFGKYLLFHFHNIQLKLTSKLLTLQLI